MPRGSLRQESACRCRSVSESALYPQAQLIATELGDRLFRNNVGMFQTLDGRYIRTGLCVGSSDLIGWRVVTITPDMVGATIAQFVALEAKNGRGKTTKEQEAFINTLIQAGGLAAVVRTDDDVRSALRSGLCLKNVPGSTPQK